MSHCGHPYPNNNSRNPFSHANKRESIKNEKVLLRSLELFLHTPNLLTENTSCEFN